MVEKIFRIMSNSEDYLTAETIAMSLLKQITLSSKENKIIFAVKEVAGENNSSSSCQEVCCS